ncbi:MAG: hypothetical protein LBG52_08150 [Candidatus Peribacteria bacterium]|nr:hypothetical protein [Candidatus Peribacteria bacterium]
MVILTLIDTTWPYLTLSTTGVAPGVYPAPAIPYFELEMYDGIIITGNVRSGKWQVTVQDLSTLANRVSLLRQNRSYNPEL